jgi:glucosamine--fructose-6-phosphate aminotransferase (isomerizing)
VHNGIIENQYELREELLNVGRTFKSETDTEIIAHLIDIARNEEKLPFRQAVLWAIKQLKGAFALAITDESSPARIICVKQSCPLIVGIGEGENFIASDFTPALSYTKRFIILEDGDIAEVQKGSIQFYSFDGREVERKETMLDWSQLSAEKEGHKHFMHKEIFDQPRALIDTLRGRYNYASGRFELDEVDTSHLRDIERICIVACGSSYYAGMIGKYLIEQMARIPVEVDLASEFRYRDVVVDSKTLVLGISQSGETADTLAALKFASDKGARLLAICNVIGSAIPRLSKATGGTLYTRAGPEISVASTKAFVAQLMALNILGLHFAQERKAMGQTQISEAVEELARVATCVEELLKSEGQLRDIAKASVLAHSMLFLGRGVGFPIALEGALKMKELSYVHAEGFAAGELKHGAIALIDPKVSVVAVALVGPHFEKILSNMQEVKSRGGRLIAVTNNPCKQLTELCDHIIVLPKTSPILSPILAAIPLQLLAYHMADLRGLDVDQPRNLAKSVTVE